MRYLGLIALSSVVAAGSYFSASVALAPAPIAAEYWVREMLVIKRGIAGRYRGQRKIIVAGGSSVLFGIDTVVLGRELRVPALNFGLHAAMPLTEILDEAARAAGAGDAVILALEPRFYCDPGLSAWQARNAIAWDHDLWRGWSMRQRLQAVARLGPFALIEIASSRAAQAWAPGSIRARLAAFDDARVLARFEAAPPPQRFAYSAENLDYLGNMRGLGGPEYRGSPRPADGRVAVCAQSVEVLRNFVDAAGRRQVAVRFALAPYVADGRATEEAIDAASAEFARRISSIAPVLERRRDVLFARGFFLDTDLHLNARGRALRTQRLIAAVCADRDLRRLPDIHCPPAN